MGVGYQMAIRRLPPNSTEGRWWWRVQLTGRYGWRTVQEGPARTRWGARHQAARSAKHLGAGE